MKEFKHWKPHKHQLEMLSKPPWANEWIHKHSPKTHHISITYKRQIMHNIVRLICSDEDCRIFVDEEDLGYFDCEQCPFCCECDVNDADLT